MLWLAGSGELRRGEQTASSRMPRGSRRSGSGKTAGSENLCRGFEEVISKLVRVVYDSPAPLFRFLRRFYLGDATVRGPTPKSASPAWAGERPFPCEPVYALGQEAELAPRSTRRGLRWRRERTRRTLVNLYAGSMTWMRSGSPDRVEGSPRVEECLRWVEESGVRPSLGGATLEAVDLFREELRLFERESWAGLSGGRSGLVSMLNELAEVCEGGRGTSGDPFAGLRMLEEKRDDARPPAGRVKMIPDALARPEESVRIPLGRWNPEEWNEVARRPKELLRDPAPLGPRPKMFLDATRTEWLQILKRRAQAKTIAGFNPKNVERGPKGEDTNSGAFAVGKDGVVEIQVEQKKLKVGRHRTIDDCRRKNWRERRYPPPVLGCGPCFCRRVIRRGHHLEYTTLDAPDFYHNLEDTEEVAKFSPLGPPITVEEAEFVGLELVEPCGDGWVQPCARTVSMGQASGVPKAQEAMVEMADKAGVDRWDLAGHALPAPEGDMWVTICIDDVVMQQEVPNHVLPEARAVMQDVVKSEKLLDIWRGEGMDPKEKKINRQVTEVIALGSEQGGASGRCGPRVRVMVQLIMINVFLMLVRTATKKILEKVVGFWGAAGLYRREMFCILDVLYKRVEGGSATKKFDLVGRSLTELFLLCVSAPTCRTDMHWQVADCFWGSDAEGYGGCAIGHVPIGEEFGRELWRYADLRGAYTTLRGDAQELEEQALLEAAERPEVGKARAKNGNPIGLPSAEEAAARREAEKTGATLDSTEGLASKDRYRAEKMALAAGGVAGLRTVRRWWNGEELPEVVDPRSALDGAVSARFPAAVLVLGKVSRTALAGWRAEGWKVCNIVDERDLFGAEGRLSGAGSWLMQQCVAGLFAGALWWVRRGLQKKADQVSLLLELLRLVGVRGGLVLTGGRRTMGFWEEPAVQSWVAREGLRVADGDACMLGEQQKGSARWATNVDEVDWDCIGLRCDHAGSQHELQRGVTTAEMDVAWEEPIETLLSGWWAGDVKLRKEAAGATGKPKKRAPPRNPWEAALGGLIEALQFKCDLAWHDDSGGHINVLETRSRRKIASRISRRRRMWHKRHPHAIDSRVGQGCGGKGRSGAWKLMRELRLALPDHLGADFQLNSVWVESLMQQLDEPSRKRAMLQAATPTAWEADVLAGRKPLVAREELKRWRRGLWRAPPPPPVRRLRWGLRGRLDLGEAKNPGPGTFRGGWGAPAKRRRVRSAPVTRRERERRWEMPPLGEGDYRKGLGLLHDWIGEKDLPFTLQSRFDTHPMVYNLVLRSWVKEAYKDEVGREFVEGAILLVQREFFWVKGCLDPTWRLIREWGLRHPYGHRKPARDYEVAAVVATCFWWGWGSLGFTVWMTWDGGLRPGEGYRQREDTLQACDALSDLEGDALVAVVEKPKTRKSFAKVQHAILEDEELVRLMKRWLKTLATKDRIWPFSSSTGGKRLKLVLQALHLEEAWTMGGLRAGRATQLWIRWRNLERLRIFMRHRRQSTLEFYVKEAVVRLLQGARPPEHREWLRRVGRMAVPWAERWVEKEERRAALGMVLREEFRRTTGGGSEASGEDEVAEVADEEADLSDGSDW